MQPVLFLCSPLLNDAYYDKFYNVILMSIHTFFLLFVHILNISFNIFKAKKCISWIFLHILNFALGVKIF